jgi:hypothetical protein
MIDAKTARAVLKECQASREEFYDLIEGHNWDSAKELGEAILDKCQIIAEMVCRETGAPFLDILAEVAHMLQQLEPDEIGFGPYEGLDR